MIDIITFLGGVFSLGALFYFFSKSKKVKEYKQCKYFEEVNTTKQ